MDIFTDLIGYHGTFGGHFGSGRKGGRQRFPSLPSCGTGSKGTPGLRAYGNPENTGDQLWSPGSIGYFGGQHRCSVSPRLPSLVTNVVVAVDDAQRRQGIFIGLPPSVVPNNAGRTHGSVSHVRRVGTNELVRGPQRSVCVCSGFQVQG